MTTKFGYVLLSKVELQQLIEQAVLKERAEGKRHLDNQKCMTRYCMERMKKAEELVQFYQESVYRPKEE